MGFLIDLLTNPGEDSPHVLLVNLVHSALDRGSGFVQSLRNNIDEIVKSLDEIVGLLGYFVVRLERRSVELADGFAVVLPQLPMEVFCFYRLDRKSVV